MSAPVMIMAGGTGGHIFPGLAVARALQARDVPVVWLGSAGGMETRIVAEAGIEIDTLRIGGLRGKGAATLLVAPFRLAMAVAGALGILRRRRPRAVVSFGGFAAGPGGLAAWLLRRPLLVHEQNAAPGLTNRVLARLARRVLAGFPDSFARADVVTVGNPVRAEIEALPAPAQRLAGRAGRPRLLVVGGSQGARALNLGVPGAVASLPTAARPEIRHQCGRSGEQATREAYAQAGVEARIEPFIADMAEAWAWADLVVCRAGASTIAEITAAGVGAVLVPFPHATDDHQTRNAGYLVERDAARLVPEGEAFAERLAAAIAEPLADPAQRLAMAEAARAAAFAQAADAVALQCLEVAR